MKRFMAAAFSLILGIGAWTACAGHPESHMTIGVIKEIQHGGDTLVIDHKSFPGFMEGMTMPFGLADPKLSQGLKVGDRVRFTITRQGDAWPITAIEKIGKRPAP